MLANERFVPREEASGLGRKLEGNSRRDMVRPVAEEVTRAAEDRLSTVPALGGVDPAVVEDADIVDAAIGLDEVVIEQVHVVVVNVDRGSATVRVTHHEIAFVFGAGLEIEDRAGETVRDSVIEVLAPAVNIFATDADER